jgi:hypothetical protein
MSDLANSPLSCLTTVITRCLFAVAQPGQWAQVLVKKLLAQLDVHFRQKLI